MYTEEIYQNKSIKELYQLMLKEFRNENNEKFIELFEYYTIFSNNALDKELMYKYAIALLKTNQEKEAMDILDVIFKISENSNIPSISDKKLYRIGMKLYDRGLYKESKKVFLKYLELNKDADAKYVNSAKGFLYEIERYENGLFNKIEVSNYLKDENNHIEEGMVVFIKPAANINFFDNNRPFLIWKIEGNKVYAFPITTNTDVSNPFYFEKEDEPKYLYINIVEFLIDDISTIYRIIAKEYLLPILKNQYYRYCSDALKNDFVKEMEKSFNIEIFDIIKIKDNDSFKYFLITNIDEEKEQYVVHEVINDNGIYKPSNIFRTISFNEFIYHTYKSSEHNCEINISNSNNLDILVGMVIEYQNNSYKVLYEKNNQLVCMLENDYSDIIYLDKLDNIRIIRKMSIEEQRKDIFFVIEFLMQQNGLKTSEINVLQRRLKDLSLCCKIL